MKHLAPYEKVSALCKGQRCMKKSAPYEKVSALRKSQRPMKKSAPMKMSEFYGNVGSQWNVDALWKSWQSIQHDIKNISVECGLLTVRPGKLYSDWSPPLLLVVLLLEVLSPPLDVAECQLSQVGLLIWSHWLHSGQPWSYQPNVSALLKRRHLIKITEK